jgi:hypothetical protein
MNIDGKRELSFEGENQHYGQIQQHKILANILMAGAVIAWNRTQSSAHQLWRDFLLGYNLYSSVVSSFRPHDSF